LPAALFRQTAQRVHLRGLGKLTARPETPPSGVLGAASSHPRSGWRSGVSPLRGSAQTGGGHPDGAFAPVLPKRICIYIGESCRLSSGFTCPCRWKHGGSTNATLRPRERAQDIPKRPFGSPNRSLQRPEPAGRRTNAVGHAAHRPHEGHSNAGVQPEGRLCARAESGETPGNQPLNPLFELATLRTLRRVKRPAGGRRRARGTRPILSATSYHFGTN